MINNLLLKIATDLCSSYKLFGEIPAGRNKKILFTAESLSVSVLLPSDHQSVSQSSDL